MIRRWLRAWLGIEDLAQAQRALAREAAQRATADRLALTRDLDALAIKAINDLGGYSAASGPATLSPAKNLQDLPTDPHLGRW